MTVFLTDYRTVYNPQSELLDDVLYPQRVHWFPQLYAKKDTGLVYVPHKLAERVLDPQLCKSLRDSASGKRCAFILAAGNQHFAGIYPKTFKRTRLTYDYKFLPLTLTQVYAGRIAQMVGAQDLVITDGCACASSLKVMTDVRRLILDEGFERVVVLAVEDTINDMVLSFFGETGACLTLKEEETGIKPSAFDAVNRGFYIGQGAVLAVFEDEYTQRKPQAVLEGAGIASEKCSNAIGQNEDGEGFEKAIEEALDDSYMMPHDVSIIKAHGTGTLSNNLAEKSAIERVFDDYVVTSYKQHIGHIMGASGLLESCLLIDDIKGGVIPHIKGRTQADIVYLSEPKTITDRPAFISLAAGMGNIYAAAIFNTNV